MYQHGTLAASEQNNGDKMKARTKLDNEYQARWLEKGGVKLNGIRIKPEANEVLKDLMGSGDNAKKPTQVINELLINAGVAK